MKKILFWVLILGAVMVATHSGNSAPQLIYLKVTVVDEVGNRVEGATVTLFKTKDDHTNETNPIATQTTDNKGKCTFGNDVLEDISYYVLVRKGDMNNYGGGEKIEALQKAKINRITIVIS